LGKAKEVFGERQHEKPESGNNLSFS